MVAPFDSGTANAVAEAAMARHLEAIKRVRINHDYAYDTEALLTEKIGLMARNCQLVLDVGQSARQRLEYFDIGKIETMDINTGDPAPDIIDDICAPTRLSFNHYDGVICMSVLEHVYNPFSAIEEIHKLLKPGGILLLHLPFIFRYHAPPDLAFTDCFRFSRDGMAWLLKDFSEVTLYSSRGPYSSMLNLQRFWKKRIEKNFGMGANKWIDKIGKKLFDRPCSDLQVSGYHAWAIK